MGAKGLLTVDEVEGVKTCMGRGWGETFTAVMMSDQLGTAFQQA